MNNIILKEIGGGNCEAISQQAAVNYTAAIRRKRGSMIPVAMRLGETPVLIPNTMVKT